MMDYNEFKKELITKLPDFLPEDLKARGLEMESVVTTNDQRREGLTPAGTTEGISGKPIIYLDDLYQQYHDGGISMETTCFLVAGHLAESMHHIPDVNGIDQQIRPDNIFIALINHKDNQEYLENVPHRAFGDLAAVYKVPVQDPKMGRGTVTVNNSLMERMGLSEEELFLTAHENMNTKMPLMVERMQDTLFLDLETVNSKTSFTFNELDKLSVEDCPMFVVSNENRYWGDGFILMKDNIEKLSDRIGTSLIIIPSSVHETIVVPEANPGLLPQCLQLVKDVNESSVDPKEQLGDSIYRYDHERRELTMHMQDGRKQEIEFPFSQKNDFDIEADDRIELDPEDKEHHAAPRRDPAEEYIPVSGQDQGETRQERKPNGYEM